MSLTIPLKIDKPDNMLNIKGQKTQHFMLHDTMTKKKSYRFTDNLE